MEAMDDLLVAPFLEALPPGEIWLDATNDPLHGNQKDVSSTGTTICRCTSATMWRVRGCGPRTSTGRRGRNWRASSNAGIGRRSSFAEMAGRDGARCDDNNADCLFGLARNARLTERVGRQLRKLRRRRVSTGKASRRFFRYRTRGSWSRARRAVAKAERRPRGVRFVAASLSREWAGAQVFYEDLHCARGENGIKERQPVRRPDVDRGRARQRASILRLSPAPGTTGPGSERFGRRGCRLRARNSAFVFFDLPLEKPFARVLANLRAAASAPTQRRPPPKAGATELACLRSLPCGVIAVRSHKCSFFAQGRVPIRPPGRDSGPLIVPKTASATRNWPPDLIRARSACTPRILFWFVLPKTHRELGVAVPHYLRRIPLALEMPAGDQEDGVSCSAAPQDSAKSAGTRSVRERNPGRRGGRTGAPGGSALKARPVPETPAAGLQDPEIICARRPRR